MSFPTYHEPDTAAMPKIGPAHVNHCKGEGLALPNPLDRQVEALPPKQKAPPVVVKKETKALCPAPAGGYLSSDQGTAGSRSVKDFFAQIPGHGSDPVEEAPRFTRTAVVAFPDDRLAPFKESKGRAGDFHSWPGCRIALPEGWKRDGTPSAAGGRWPSIRDPVQRHILFEGHLHPHQYPAGELTKDDLANIQAQESAIWQAQAEQMQKDYEESPHRPGDFPDKVKPAEYPRRDFVPKGYFPRDVSAVQVLDAAQLRLATPGAFKASEKKSSSRASYIILGQHHGALDVESDAPFKAGEIDIQVRVVATRTALGGVLRVKTCYPSDAMPEVLAQVLPALGHFLDSKTSKTLETALHKGQWGWAYNAVRDVVVARVASGELTLTPSQKAWLEYAGCLLRVVWPQRYLQPVVAAGSD